MDGALRLMDVPPDDIETWLAAQAKSEGKAGKSSTATAVAAPAALTDFTDDAADVTDTATFDAPAPVTATAPVQGGVR